MARGGQDGRSIAAAPGSLVSGLLPVVDVAVDGGVGDAGGEFAVPGPGAAGVVQEQGAVGMFVGQRGLSPRVRGNPDQGPQGPGRPDAVIAEGLDLSVRTVERARRDWAARGLAGLQTAPMDHPRNPRRLDGKGETQLVALACGRPPPGFARWTGQLLAEALVAEGVVETISATTVNLVLKKTR